MIYLAMFLIGLGCLVTGAALAARGLARDHDDLERERALLDAARADVERQAALLRESLGLARPDAPVAIDLGAHRRRGGLLS